MGANDVTTLRITSVANGTETLVIAVEGGLIRSAASHARQLRDASGLEHRVYDDLGLVGVMDARAAA